MCFPSQKPFISLRYALQVIFVVIQRNIVGLKEINLITKFLHFVLKQQQLYNAPKSD